MFGWKSFRTAAALCLATTASATFAAESYRFDTGHSEITFSWDHAGVSVQSGEFLEFQGNLNFDPDDPSASAIDVVIQTNSIHSGSSALDWKLEGPEFFSAKKFPEITFKSTSVVQTGKHSADVTGDLTMKGVTSPVTLAVDLVHRGEHPYGKSIPSAYSGNWLGFRAVASLNRSDFNLGKYRPLTSDRIQISINVEMRQNQ